MNVLSFFIGRYPVELAKRAKYEPPAMRVRGVVFPFGFVIKKV